MKELTTGMVFDIKRYAIHDGPGIRTTVFMKGCPLSCQWCHNPEGLSIEPCITYDAKQCIGCRECITACPENALELTPQGIILNKDVCTACGCCADICTAKAREMAGRQETVSHLLDIISRDRLFYETSGGGVTFSGGEPLLQWKALVPLLKGCSKSGIHRAVDTSGYCPWEALEEVAKHTDLFLFDLKLMDDTRHMVHTGVSNELILSNLKKLSRTGISLIIRVPLIPGINTDSKNLKKTGAFIAGLTGVQQVDLMPYHDFQRSKYMKFSQAYPGEQIPPITEPEIATASDILQSFGLNLHVH